jgi:hypothetical protein
LAPREYKSKNPGHIWTLGTASIIAICPAILLALPKTKNPSIGSKNDVKSSPKKHKLHTLVK